MTACAYGIDPISEIILLGLLIAFAALLVDVVYDDLRKGRR